MKKVILASLVAASSCLGADSSGYYFTPTIGKVLNESSDLNEEKIFGFRVGIPFENNFGFDTAEFAFDRQNGVGYTILPQETTVNRFSANALKHYTYANSYVPYGLAGVGYETFSNEKLDVDDALFINVGVGIKYKLQNDMSLMTDIRHIIRLAELDSHTIFNVGLVIPFGNTAQKNPASTYEEKPLAKEPEVLVLPPKDSDNDGVIDDMDKCPNTPSGFAVNAEGCCLDSDGDGVKDPQDKCPTTPMGVQVDSNGCCLDSDNDGIKDFEDACPTTPAGFAVDAKGCCLDSDGDGVKDPQDKCPNTPAGFKVDSIGCEIGYNLKINFDTNKAEIKHQYNDEIAKFVLFMNAFPVYKAQIGGHTDNIGNPDANKKLSQERADSVKERFIKDGIDASRLSAVGYGQEKPIASNESAEGRNENRRIEVILSK